MDTSVDNGFISFVCNACHQEIEASLDMIGERTECPACGAPLTVPSPQNQDAKQPSQPSANRTSADEAALNAMKSRTIRIELSNI
jgi:hypothetical protein